MTTKKYYVEYDNGNELGRSCWCVCEANTVEDIKYTIEKVYGFKFIRAEELYKRGTL